MLVVLPKITDIRFEPCRIDRLKTELEAVGVEVSTTQLGYPVGPDEGFNFRALFSREVFS